MPVKTLLVTFAAALAAAATLALGFWQWGRGEQKIALHAAQQARAVEPSLGVGALTASGDPLALVHRRIALKGHWLADRTVFLDNRQMNARPGFYVVTPLKLESGAVILVQRGWAPRNFSQRDALPPIQTPTGQIEVTGRLAPPPAKLYAFAAEERGLIRQNLDLALFRQETGLALLPMSLQQIGAPSEGLAREWPQPASGADKNYGYAFQWWALSGLIVLLYVWFQFIVPRQRARQRPA